MSRFVFSDLVTANLVGVTVNYAPFGFEDSMMKVNFPILVTALSLAGVTSATAATYTATSAVGVFSNHSIWLKEGLGPDLGVDFDFQPDGQFITFPDGSGGTNAVLTGSVLSDTGAGAGGFFATFVYDSVWTDGFTPTFKPGAEFGSAFDNNDDGNGLGYFLDMESGLLQGTGVLDGLTLALVRMPAFDADETGPGDGGTPDYATQVGGSVDGVQFGANNKNTNYGLANWFFVESAVCVAGKACAGRGTDYSYLVNSIGDVNIDLSGPGTDAVVMAPVPVPAAGVLLLAGLAGLGAYGARRRRR